MSEGRAPIDIHDDVDRAPRASGSHDADPFDELPDGRTILLRLGIGLVAMIGVLTALGFAFTELGFLSGLRDWDESINDTLADSRSGWASDLAKLVTSTGDTAPILAFMALVTAGLALARRWRAMTFLPMSIVFEISTFLAVNHMVTRPRPDVERIGPLPSTYSFPSGHIAATFVCWFALAVLLHLYSRVVLSRVAGFIGAVMTCLMGWARVYVGMHHLVDVIVGLAMGITALLLGMYTLGLLRRRPDDPVA